MDRLKVFLDIFNNTLGSVRDPLLVLDSERALVKVNYATLPSNLIESELFGHEKGAFIGANSRHSGNRDPWAKSQHFAGKDEKARYPQTIEPGLFLYPPD